MANELAVFDIGNLVAAADLSDYQYYLVYVSAANTVARRTTSGGDVLGVLQNKPEAAGRSAQVRHLGITQVVAGAVVAVGAKVMSDSSGRAITATATLKYFGTAIEASTAAGQRITVIMEHGYVPAAN